MYCAVYTHVNISLSLSLSLSLCSSMLHNSDNLFFLPAHPVDL